MEIQELIKGIPLILLFAFIAYGAIISSRREKEEKEVTIRKLTEDKQKNDEAIRAEMDIGDNAYAMLPDIDAAMTILKEKYGWREILETIGASPIELKPLRVLSPGQSSELDLPNMQSSRYSSDESRVVASVREIFTMMILPVMELTHFPKSQPSHHLARLLEAAMSEPPSP